MESHLAGELGSLRAAEGPKPFADRAVQLRARDVRQPLVDDLSVERVAELVVRVDAPVRERVQSGCADQPLTVAEPLAKALDLFARELGRRLDRPHREAFAGRARGLQHLLLAQAERIEVQGQQLSQGVRNDERHLVDRDAKRPGPIGRLDHPSLQHILHQGRHEERVSVAVPVDEVCQAGREAMPGALRSQILGDLRGSHSMVAPSATRVRINSPGTCSWSKVTTSQPLAKSRSAAMSVCAPMWVSAATSAAPSSAETASTRSDWPSAMAAWWVMRANWPPP